MGFVIRSDKNQSTIAGMRPSSHSDSSITSCLKPLGLITLDRSNGEAILHVILRYELRGDSPVHTAHPGMPGRRPITRRTDPLPRLGYGTRKASEARRRLITPLLGFEAYL